jgi:hypothetical protein
VRACVRACEPVGVICVNSIFAPEMHLFTAHKKSACVRACVRLSNVFRGVEYDSEDAGHPKGRVWMFVVKTDLELKVLEGSLARSSIRVPLHV